MLHHEEDSITHLFIIYSPPVPVISSLIAFFHFDTALLDPPDLASTVSTSQDPFIPTSLRERSSTAIFAVATSRLFCSTASFRDKLKAFFFSNTLSN